MMLSVSLPAFFTSSMGMLSVPGALLHASSLIACSISARVGRERGSLFFFILFFFGRERGSLFSMGRKFSAVFERMEGWNEGMTISKSIPSRRILFC